jgi:hypothetical protein
MIKRNRPEPLALLAQNGADAGDSVLTFTRQRRLPRRRIDRRATQILKANTVHILL